MRGHDDHALTTIEYRHGGSTAWAAERADTVLGASLSAVITAANTSNPDTVEAA